MFAVDRRSRLRDLIVEHASADADVVAAAEVGSQARGEADAWSDIDVSLRLADGRDVEAVAAGWARWLSEIDEVADTLDVHAAGATYRVFLMADSLQVDVSFFPYDAFRATGGEPMAVHFGEALPEEPPRTPDWHGTARTGWLYLLHARSAVARRRTWQAELMLAEARAIVLALAAQRLGLRADHGRQAHLLPAEVTDPLGAARAVALDTAELTRSLAETVACYLAEVRHGDPVLHAALVTPLESLAGR